MSLAHAHELEKAIDDAEIPLIARENSATWRRETNASKIVSKVIWKALHAELGYQHDLTIFKGLCGHVIAKRFCGTRAFAHGYVLGQHANARRLRQTRTHPIHRRTDRAAGALLNRRSDVLCLSAISVRRHDEPSCNQVGDL